MILLIFMFIFYSIGALNGIILYGNNAWEDEEGKSYFKQLFISGVLVFFIVAPIFKEGGF